MSPETRSMMTEADINILRCPRCQAELALAAERHARHGSMALTCGRCGATWPIVDGFPDLVHAETLHTADCFLNFVYDAIAPFHDFGTSVALPLAQCVSDREVRSRVVRCLDLGDLHSRNGLPLRILEVGSGTGINWPIVEDTVPVHLDVEFWAVDLSTKMLAQTRRRANREVARRVRIIRADVHNLPFADASFDRVFHVGAVSTFGDQRLALAEMARVAVPGSPIVIVDERLDPAKCHPLHRRALFKALTWYDRNPDAPGADQLPKGAVFEVVQVSLFFYCMSFRVGTKIGRKRG